MTRKRAFPLSLFLLILAGLLINYAGAQLALLVHVPLFLDSIGTIFCAVVGGYLPGVVVGFLSNLINGISDPITLYYGIVSIAIAVTASFLSHRAWFCCWWKTLIAAFLFAVIGGGGGSVLTWMLYGFNFGQGISAPFAVYLFHHSQMSQFWAQFAADMAIDFADKIFSTALVFVAVQALPLRFVRRFSLGKYCRRERTPGGAVVAETSIYVHFPLRHKMLVLIVGSTIILGMLTTGISAITYHQIMRSRYITTCRNVEALMRRAVNAEKIDSYLAEKNENDATYRQSKQELRGIKSCFPEIEFLYLYQIREDGCHVVFDLDTDTVKASALGEVVARDASFASCWQQLLDGKPIEPVESNDAYGWLLTVYTPVYAADGHCVAYMGVDVSMRNIMTDQYVFIIKLTSLLFGASIVILVIAVFLADNQLMEPINHMTSCADRLLYRTKEDRVHSLEQVTSLDIHTHDEVESLYHAMVQSTQNIVQYIDTIEQLQFNTLMEFADVVEKRDDNTGEHIRRTAFLVGRLSRQLRDDGHYVDQLSDAEISSLEKCAPLHDVGKIRIADAILNKPGRLTAEEFDIMKTHTTAGGEILQHLMQNTNGLSYLKESYNMALYHHERWDGTGYPNGLSGENIPLSARIMAVADVYDALISRRSYKESFSKEEACAIIVQESGTHFDPLVVEAFVNAFDREQEKASATFS